VPTARTVAQLREAAWQAFTTATDAGKSITATHLAEAARITTGAALRFLTEWAADGRAARLPLTPPPGPYLTPWTAPGADAITDRHTTQPPERRAPAVPTSLAPATPEPEEPITTALRAAALSYAARGWHVFPLRPGDKRPAFPGHTQDRCTGADPRCRAAGRHVTWEERATTDPDRISRAWSSVPYGIGIACGPSGLVLVDLDVPKPGQTPPPQWQRPGVVDGTDVFTYLVHEHGGDAHPATPAVLTCSGGGHLYYSHPTGPGWDGIRLGNTSKALGWLVDTRAWGGYVVAPPTVVGGNPYRWTSRAALAPLPGWIGDALRPMPRKPVPSRTTALTDPQGGSRADAYVLGALSAEASHVAQAVPGERNLALFVAAANLGELVAGGALLADDARAALMAAATVHIGTGGFTATEAEKTIASGLRKGGTRPRRISGEAA
jgi:hypothetical protein